MKKLSLLLLLLLFNFSCSYNTVTDIDNIGKHYVCVFTDSNFGSGIVIDTGYVIISKHVVGNSSIVLIVNELSVDTAYIIGYLDDQVLARVKSIKSSLILIGDSIHVGQTVWWIQPIFDGKSLNLYMNSGRINGILANSFFVDKPILPGASGSGVFNSNGELVGIIEASIYYGNQILYGKACNYKNANILLKKIGY